MKKINIILLVICSIYGCYRGYQAIERRRTIDYIHYLGDRACVWEKTGGDAFAYMTLVWAKENKAKWNGSLTMMI